MSSSSFSSCLYLIFNVVQEKKEKRRSRLYSILPTSSSKDKGLSKGKSGGGGGGISRSGSRSGSGIGRDDEEKIKRGASFVQRVGHSIQSSSEDILKKASAPFVSLRRYTSTL